jgi:hypothetical protein
MLVGSWVARLRIANNVEKERDDYTIRHFTPLYEFHFQITCPFYEKQHVFPRG